jgi:hypothetical protein
MKRFRMLVIAAGMLVLVSCGGESGAGGSSTHTLEGTYLPQHPPNAPRYEISLTDRQWVFSKDGTVRTTTTDGTHIWEYRIQANTIQQRGTSERRRGQTRRMTLGDDGCIFDGPQQHPGFTRFCPQ